MKTELNVQPEFYSIFRAYHQGGPLNLDLLPSVVDKQRLKGSYPLICNGRVNLPFFQFKEEVLRESSLVLDRI